MNKNVLFFTLGGFLRNYISSNFRRALSLMLLVLQRMDNGLTFDLSAAFGDLYVSIFAKYN
jgi:hypothetical protein